MQSPYVMQQQHHQSKQKCSDPDHLKLIYHCMDTSGLSDKPHRPSNVTAKLLPELAAELTQSKIDVLPKLSVQKRQNLHLSAGIIKSKACRLSS